MNIHACWDCGRVTLSGVCPYAHPGYSHARAILEKNVVRPVEMVRHDLGVIATLDCEECGYIMRITVAQFIEMLRGPYTSQRPKFFCSAECMSEFQWRPRHWPHSKVAPRLVLVRESELSLS